jgi:hypothetical protein
VTDRQVAYTGWIRCTKRYQPELDERGVGEEMLQDFITLLRMVCNLKLIVYFCNFPFNMFRSWSTVVTEIVKSKTAHKDGETVIRFCSATKQKKQPTHNHLYEPHIHKAVQKKPE